jgi:subfamily B ATP-binding cassette protein MsbA
MTLYNPIKKFSSVNVQLQMGLAAGERVFELLDQKGTVLDHPAATEAPTLSKGIDYKNVGFEYRTGVPVLDDVNFSIKKGEIVALVGASGSGKSTIAQLLLRFYDPTSGQILFDGHDMRNLSVSSLRRQMAVVTQETHLFNDTIASNIAYGRTTASHNEIEDAAKAAYAHDFISRLPQGYETVIGERGTRLSGGERQRLAIARSLLKNPTILVLDEATSALDAESEQAVQLAFDRLLEGRTVLMIAHRLSTVRKAHRIIVLENGKIKETGSHDELLTKKGAYHKLYQLQATI